MRIKPNIPRVKFPKGINGWKNTAQKAKDVTDNALAVLRTIGLAATAVVYVKGRIRKPEK